MYQNNQALRLLYVRVRENYTNYEQKVRQINDVINEIKQDITRKVKVYQDESIRKKEFMAELDGILSAVRSGNVLIIKLNYHDGMFGLSVKGSNAAKLNFGSSYDAKIVRTIGRINSKNMVALYSIRRVKN